MIKKSIFLVFAVFCFSQLFPQQLQSPDEFLPHKLGEQFTPHHLLVDYFQYIAENSDQVKLIEYGRSYEGRPLLMAYLSTKENINNLEQIRKNNLSKTGLPEGEAKGKDVAIVWLSYGVHGNEASSPESAMLTLYKLIKGGEEIANWLENTVIIMDPALNPDGWTRYSGWHRRVANVLPDPSTNTREHLEPWPGGRTNHYYFDLNRDWAWQTQKESVARLKMYYKWMPQVHVDFHEQGPNSPYYFAPAARPYHEYVTDWQAKFQHMIGKNHAKYFDENGWMYFTKEVFDLLYPSYGDTYPTFNGAIGMTYEQAGSGRGGRAYLMENGDTLTLMDRIQHHTTAGLSTIETASKNAGELIENFENYFKNASNKPSGDYKTYCFKAGENSGRLKSFCELLDKNNILYGKAGKSHSVSAFDYQSRKNKSISIEANDLIVSAYQPMSVLAQVLMDPETYLEDSATYDITAWSLPYAYGLECYATRQKILAEEKYHFKTSKPTVSKSAYAYIFSWNSLKDARFLAALFKAGIKVRVASEAFSLEGHPFAPGSVIASHADNRKLASFDQKVQKVCAAYNKTPITVNTGFSDSGPDLGSGAMRFIEVPKIALLSGEPTSSSSFGQAWHFFEQVLEYPIQVYAAENLDRIDLDDYNLLIIPEGYYRWSEKEKDPLNDWVRNGGRIIAIGSAIRALQNSNGRSGNGNNKKDSSAEKEPDNYSERYNQRLAGRSRGSIVKLKMDNTHPLAYGFPDYYYSLKTGGSYSLNDAVWDVGVIGEDPVIVGFAGEKAKEDLQNTTVFAVENKGSGSITYLGDNPLYRGFWENGLFLFSNAVFFVE